MIFLEAAARVNARLMRAEGTLNRAARINVRPPFGNDCAESRV
jgi:hypothetical protein